MKIFKLALSSILGAAAGSFILNSMLIFLLLGVLPVASLAVISLFSGVLFGLCYTVAHCRRAPTALSSLLFGLAYVVVSVLLLWISNHDLSFSIVSDVLRALTAVALGGGAFVGALVSGTASKQ